MLQAKLATERWDLIVLVETWVTAVPSEIVPLLRSYRYHAHLLPASLSCLPARRDKRGIMVLVRQSLPTHSITTRRCEYGEYVSLTLSGVCRVIAVYRDGTHTARAYDSALDIFTDAASATPTLWLGDFNWTLQHPPDLHTPAALTSCTATPPGSRFSQQQAAHVTKRLAAYPLSVLSAFQPTHTAGRCIDYALGNARLLEVFETRQLFQIPALASDHSVVALTL